MAKFTTANVEKNESDEVLIIYAQDVAYIGKVKATDLENIADGVVIRKPFVINIRPITEQSEGKLETVILDVLLPIEFGGLPLSENMYTGMVNFSPAPLQLSNGKSSVVQIEGGTVGVNRLSSIAEREDALIWIFDVQKVLMPSSDMKVVYEAKAARYNELLYAPRMVELQAMSDQQQDGLEIDPEKIDSTDQKSKATVIDMSSKTVH